jgi:hypothetical protein
LDTWDQEFVSTRIAYRSVGSQTEAMIALAGKGPAVYPMGDYWQAIAYRKARPRRCSGSSRLYVGGTP